MPTTSTPRRRRIILSAAFAVLATTGTLATGPSASAAAQCRQVTAKSISVYRVMTGGKAADNWPQGTTFQHFGAQGKQDRWYTWLPRGVPRNKGYDAWAQNTGSKKVSCPW
jgi:hypothetical protein